MFDAQRLKIKTVIVNSSGHMHVTRAYFYIFFLAQPAKEESSQVLLQREITDCDFHVLQSYDVPYYPVLRVSLFLCKIVCVRLVIKMLDT